MDQKKKKHQINQFSKIFQFRSIVKENKSAYKMDKETLRIADREEATNISNVISNADKLQRRPKCTNLLQRGIKHFPCI